MASHQGTTRHTHKALPECDFHVCSILGYLNVMLRSLCLALLAASTLSATAQSNGLPVEGSLLSGWREADARHMAGLSLRLAPGWKTYWRSPGAGGIPPQFNWSGSRNLAAVRVMFPVPKVMEQNGLRSIGYDRDVVFPLIVSAQDPSQPVTLRAEVEVGVCEDVCIPVTLRVKAELPVKGDYDASIGASLENQPGQGGRFECEITPIADGLELKARTDKARINAEIVVIEIGEPGVWVSPSDTSQNGQNLTAEVEMVPPNARPFALARNDVRMTLIGGGRAVEMRGCR